MKLLAVCSLLLSALCLRAELAFKWTVEVSQPLPYSAEAFQGESFNLEAKVVQYRVPMLEAAEATFYYQTSEMEASQWYTAPAAWDATTATASVTFTPAMDVGSTKYRFFFGIETAQGKNYRVFGTLRLKASPGFSPATLTPTDVRAEIIQEILEAVFEEADDHYATKEEYAALAVQVQGKANASHTHADLQQSATVLLQAINSEAEIREEADAALGEQLGALEAELEQEARVREMADAEIVDALEGKVSSLRTAPAAPSNNADCYGYRGTLRALGATGEAVVVGRVAVLTRASGNQNASVSLWARLLRNVNGAWVVAAQAKTPRKWSDVRAGSELAWEMASIDGVAPPSADEEIAIVWVNNSEAGASTSNGSLSFQTIDLAGGLQYELPASPTISSSRAAWSPRIVLDYAPFSSGDNSGEGSVTMEEVQNTALRITDGDNRLEIEKYGGVVQLKLASMGDSSSNFVLPRSIDSALSATSTNPVQNKIIAVQLAKRTIATASGGYLMDIATDNGTGIRFSTQDLNASGYLNLWYLNNGGTGTGMSLLTSTALDPLYDRLSAVEELAREPVARSSHAIAWQEGTSLLTVTPNADGAVVFDPTGWPEGQSLLVRLTTPEDFGGVPASVRLVGYFDIEPASTYQLTAYVVGGTLHVVPLLREE